MSESNGLDCLPRQLAGIIAAMLLAGCATPRSEFLGSGTANGLTPAAISASEHSPVRLASAEETASGQPETLPGPEPVDPLIPGPPVEELDLPAGESLPIEEAISLAFQRQPRLRVFLEGIQQAGGRSDIAFAPYL